MVVSDRGLRTAAAGVVVASLACSVAALVLHLEARSRATGVQGFEWSSMVVASAWPLAGLVVVRAQPRNRAGWLLLATSALSLYQLFGEYSIWSHYVSPLPLSAFTDWTSMWGFAVYLLVMPLVPLLFPDGRLPSPRWRRYAWSIAAAAATLALARMLVPGPSDVDGAIENPIDLPGLAALNFVVAAMAIYCVVGILIGIVALLLRTRRAVGRERIQLQWLLLGGVLLFAGLLLSSIPIGMEEAFLVGLLGPPVTIVVAVLRHRLFDVDVALSRSVVFLGVLLVVVAGGTWLLLRIDPAVAGTRRGALLVAGLALAAVAARWAAQRLIDRWWFPHRQDAGLLGRRISEAVSSAAEPRAALADLVRSVRTTLRLPYVGFAGRVEAASGERPAHVVALDAVAMGRTVGTLEVAPRREGEGFSRQERQVLEETAAQAAMLAFATQLVADVEESRASIVGAREEERRRLRNDLHDGVGPTLAGIALQADVLARRLEAGRAPETERAAAIRDAIRAAVADVRAVSHGLRPPILDQIGLSAAVRQLVAGLEAIAGEAQVDELDGIPAATEVAIYSIAAEAVGNAVRHSAGSRLRVDAVRSEAAVVLTVSDNGRGMPASPRAGVGLSSMRQRAAEVGGRLEHAVAPGGGTVVELTLPL